MTSPTAAVMFEGVKLWWRDTLVVLRVGTRTYQGATLANDNCLSSCHDTGGHKHHSDELWEDAKELHDVACGIKAGRRMRP